MSDIYITSRESPKTIILNSNKMHAPFSILTHVTPLFWQNLKFPENLFLSDSFLFD